MEISGERKIQASREEVWTALNDPDVLRQAIPGAESVVQTADTEFEVTASAAAGPVSGRFLGKVRFTDIDAPDGWTVNVETDGGPAGFARGTARITLKEIPEGTLLSYSIEAQMGGKLAQIGQRPIEDATTAKTEAFFANIAQLVTSAGTGTDAELPEIVEEMSGGIPVKSPDSDPISPTGVPLLPDEEAGFSLSPWLWGPLLILALILLLWLVGF
ncbi:SRPBCC family protein [Parvibaculum sp.]|uniref:SRPBCC family protein n=1 Tax=Parvibaculum sp. TaxID=2024848 RepID=UPI003C771A7F